MKKIYQTAILVAALSFGVNAQNNDVNFSASEESQAAGEISVTIGLEVESISKKISAYSFDSKLFINMTDVVGNAAVTVYSTNGQIVATATAVNGLNTLEVNAPSVGVYLVKVEANGEVLTEKVFLK